MATTKTATGNGPLLLLAVAMIVVGFVSTNRGQETSPLSPEPSARLQLLEHFQRGRDRREARQHARDLATICDAFAETIEFDNEQPEPRFRNGAQLADARVSLVEFRLHGWSFGHEYPTLGPAIKAFLDEEIGLAGGPVDRRKRQTWADAMRELAKASRHAASQL